MKTKQTLIAMALIAAMSATTAMAQGTSAPAATPAAQGNDKDAGAGRHKEKFEEFKAKALERLEKRAAAIQQKQACVQAATDRDSLKACFPKRGEGKRHREGNFQSGGSPASADAPASAAPAKK